MCKKIKLATASPEIKVADPFFNASSIEAAAKKAASSGSKVLLTPELSLSAYTCQDLFFNVSLADSCLKALISLQNATRDLDLYIFVGLPVFSENKIYNCMVALYKGDINAVFAKNHMTSYTHERAFEYSLPDSVVINGNKYALSNSITIQNDITLQVAIGAIKDKLNINTKVLLNPFSLPAPTDTQYFTTFTTKNKGNLPIILLSNASCTESTTDFAFSGQNMIISNDSILKTDRFEFKGSFCANEVSIKTAAITTEFTAVLNEKETIKRCPYMPYDEKLRAEYIEEILNIQATGILRRMMYIGTQKTVVGISGGLDSTLSLVALVHAYDKAGYNKKNICAITMPGFGTSHTTKNNAVDLIDALGVTKKEISIKDACIEHFKDIGHDGRPDTAYENAQARERTQILMDYSNMIGALMIGTGDLSEEALGFSTYNGDQMAMYSPNASIPKTVIRLIIDHVAEKSDDKLKQVLKDILTTPISPELVNNADNEKITQKTEEIVGPYELHDFFLYYFIKGRMSTKDIKKAAVETFTEYTNDQISNYLKIFIKRFFAGQFKRSCSPDGAMATVLSLSPRGGLFMPSDAPPTAFLDF